MVNISKIVTEEFQEKIKNNKLKFISNIQPIMYRLDEIRNILLNELFNNSIFPTLNTKSLQVVT